MASPGYHFTSSMGLDDWCSKLPAAAKPHSSGSTPYGSVEGMIGDRGANDLAGAVASSSHPAYTTLSTSLTRTVTQTWASFTGIRTSPGAQQRAETVWRPRAPFRVWR